MAPKRPADAYTSAAFPTDRATTSTSGKRTRYAPPNAKTVLSEPTADDLELDLEGTGGTQNSNRNKVVTDGYDSDSSGGEDGDGAGFGGAGGGRRGRAKRGGAAGPGEETGLGDEDGDDDMFGPAGGDDEMDAIGGKGKRKADDQAKKEWLEMGDIEGQEFSKRDMRDDDDDDGAEMDDDDGEEDEEDYDPVDDHANDDDAPRGRRSKKGMGFQLSSFNMKEELNEGRFSADGSYVANAVDPLAAHDSWLSGVSKHEIRLAREAKERMDRKQREQDERDARLQRGDEGLTQVRDDCLIGLVGEVRPRETVANALNRLGRGKKRAEQFLARVEATPDDAPARAAAAATGLDAASLRASIARYTAKIDRLTHFASTLLSTHGELEIYDQRHDDIVQTLKSEGAVRRDWAPASASKEEVILEEKEERAWREVERRDKEQARGGGGEEQAPRTTTTRDGRSRVVISRPAATTSAPGPSASSASEQFYYKWNPPAPGQPAEPYGPYSRTDLESWISQGYFGDKDSADRILVRKDEAGGAAGAGEFRAWRDVR
ncbi:hypothetical protein JCM10212_003649 [Sporobolomyces blumeae]